MRHPALTRFLSVVLTITCIIMLFASLSGLRKAEKLRLEDEKVFSKLQQRITVYEQLSASLEGVKDYKQANEELEKEEQQHEKDSSQHRSDVAMHTAEEGGYQAGADALWEAKAKLAEQRAGYEQAKREYKRQEAQFNQQKAAVEGIKTLAEACAAAAALPPVPHPGTAPAEPACPAAPVEPIIPDDPGQFTLTAPAPEQYESEEAYQAALLEYNNALMAYTAKKNAYDQAVAAAESYPARLLAYQQAMEEYNNVTLPAYQEEKAKYDAKAKAYEIIRELNGEMEKMGYLTVRGRVNSTFFHKKTDYQKEVVKENAGL